MATETAPLIESSTYKSYQSFVNCKDVEDIMDKVPHRIAAQYAREQDFLSQVDASKGPIKRTILSMVRTRVNGKEYLYYTENWNATDWKNAEVNPIVDRMEGIHQEVVTRPKVDERGRKIASEYVRTNDVYDIPYSREAVDKLIAETGTDRDSIKYHIKNTELGRRGKCFYSQFVGVTWNQATDILMQDGGFDADYTETLISGKPAKK
jgi:hypothetical protein